MNSITNSSLICSLLFSSCIARALLALPLRRERAFESSIKGDDFPRFVALAQIIQRFKYTFHPFSSIHHDSVSNFFFFCYSQLFFRSSQEHKAFLHPQGIRPFFGRRDRFVALVKLSRSIHSIHPHFNQSRVSSLYSTRVEIALSTLTRFCAECICFCVTRSNYLRLCVATSVLICFVARASLPLVKVLMRREGGGGTPRCPLEWSM